MKKILQWLLPTILGIFILYNGCIGLKKEIYNDTKQLYCGKVVEKNTEERYSKNQYSGTDRYLVVRFDEIAMVPVVRSIKVDVNTFFTENVGSDVCFKLDKRTIGMAYEQSMIEVLCLIVLFMGAIIGIIIVIINIVDYLYG